MLGEVLAGNGDIADLAVRFRVSVSTVRRDLQQLAADGHVHRTYGGAVAGERAAERSLGEKESGHRQQKEAIARAAAEEISDGDCVLLDAGTTTGRLAWHLRARAALTVVTNSTTTLRHLADAPGVELVVLGGRVRRPNGAILGPVAVEMLRGLAPDRVFIGADGLDPRDGLSCPSLELAHAKQLMTERGRSVYVVADASKLGSSPFPYRATINRPWTLMTDTGADPEVLQAFRDSGLCTVVTAEA